MKKLLMIALIGGAIASCKFAANEMKKVGKVRRAAKKVCNCTYVNVESDYEPGSNTLTITVQHTRSENHRNVADSIITNVKKEFPNLCNHDEVFVVFEQDDFDEQYTYYGCDMNAIVDTFYYDYDEWEEFEEEMEEFEEFEEEEVAATPPPQPADIVIPATPPIEEIEEEEEIEIIEGDDL